jgi:uroporphyrinogen-III synthase
MRVLVIRPEPDATRTAALLERSGHQALVAPVLRTEWLQPELPDGAALVVLTSANAVRALAGRAGPFLATPTVAVGAATAAAARAAGFLSVVSADGTAVDVAATVARLDLPAGAAVFYPAAEEPSDPLDERLARFGLKVTVVPVYRTVAVEAWPAAAVAAVAAGDVDVVQVMSRRSGAALAALVARHGIQSTARRISIHAIAHQAVPSDLAAAFGSVTIATAPSLDGLMALLQPPDDGGASNIR